MFRRLKNWFRSLFKKPNVVIGGDVTISYQEQGGQVIITRDSQKFDSDFQFVDGSHHHATRKVNNVFKEDLFDASKYPAPLFLNKCTEGTYQIDPTHTIRKKKCADAGILYGGYHFFKTNISWQDQFDYYLDAHGDFVIPPIVDYEITEGRGSQNEDDLIRHISQLYKMLIKLEMETGKIPWIYLNYSFAKRANFPEEFGRFPAWFARYNSFLGPIPAPWTEETTFAWQFTESGEFEGLGDKGDVNIYFAKSEVLKAKNKPH